MAYQAAFLFVIFLIFRVITGIALFMAWREKKKQNLLILFLFFVANGVTLVFLIFESVLLYDFSTIASIIIILIFIDHTFYQDRKSPFKLLLISTLVLGALAITFFTLYDLSIISQTIGFTVHNYFVGALFLVFGIWSFVAASTSLKSIKSSEAVEPWVKSRYGLVRFYSVGIILVGLFTPFTPMAGTLNWALLAILIANMLRIAGETLAWVMPKWLKNYFNR